LSSLLTLGALKTAPGCARGHVNAVLHEWGLAIVRLRLLSDGTRVVVEVWEEIPIAPVARPADANDESGRGLMLVEAYCAQWGYGSSPGWPGKVVWAELAAANQP